MRPNPLRFMTGLGAAWLGLGMLATALAAGPEPAPVVQLSLKLRDGSLILGKINDDELQVASEALGTMKMPLSRLRVIKFGGAGKPDAITFKNGDKLQGETRFTKITVDTLFGRVTVPKDLLVEMEVRALGERARSVTWRAIPFPENSDWPGPRGERAQVTDSELIIRGQPVRGSEEFAPPTTISWEVMVDDLAANDGGCTLVLYPGELPAEIEPEKAVSLCFGYRGRHAQTGFLTMDQRLALRDVRNLLPERAVPLKAGQWHKLSLETTTAGMTIGLDDQRFSVPGNGLPYEHFRLQFMGWQPGNTWHIRHVEIR